MATVGAKSAAIPACPGEEQYVHDQSRLEPSQFRRLVERRARRLFGRAERRSEDEARRRSLEEEVEIHFEKIHKGRDFLPVDFLDRGAARARAVCRISTRSSLGTGFLIGPGVLMTNNHVLGNEQEAAGSFAEFDFEAGKQPLIVAIRPGDLFITDRDLDFTIVACDSDALGGIDPVRLLRNPATATRNDRVNVIQHPSGRRKEIAIHDNRVVDVRNLVLRYRTDTEPGSSGSPVFNNEWELVALHHAGVRQGDTAENEGIRVSSIVAHLIDLSGGGGQESLRRVLDQVTDTSPDLGFFDVHGLRKSALEVQVNGFQGTPDFADVGVWNIEHFNGTISNRRVQDVAEVLVNLNTDVMGLTEVEKPALDRLLNEMASRGSDTDFVSINVSGRQDLAVLFDRDTTKVDLRDDLADEYADQLAARTSAGRTAFPRRPLFAECTVGDNGDEVRFMMMVVHLKAFGDSQSQARRRLASRMLAEIVADIREKQGIPVVLGGDFNERLDTDVLNALKTSPDLFSLTADDATTDAISFVGNSHRSLIDHILVSNDVRLGEIAGDDAAIVRLDRSAADFPDTVSDHVPVIFRMVLRDDVIDVDEQDGSQGVEVDIPAGAEKVRLSFNDEE